MMDFSEFIFDQGPMGIPLVSESFTWSNNRDFQALSRIDRFLHSPEWEEQFRDVSHMRLLRIMLDNFPLMLDCGVLGRGSWHFKFDNMWLKSESFVEQVETWWMSYCFQGSPSYVLARKLKAFEDRFEEVE